MPPVIGISPCRLLADYVESVRRAGGEPHVFDTATKSPADVMSSIDGLLLPGGADIDPTFYGEERTPAIKPAEAGRDAFEIDIARRAVAANLPTLAVCRGLQVLNVAAGGTLMQDIPSQVSGALEHSVETPLYAIAHEVWVTRSTRLWVLLQDKLAESEICQVNSRHHQALKRVAEGFEVAATAPDGVIEAIERPDARFCVGVQWHPENFWRTGEFRPLFEGFVAACE
jgi:putative glutamine amidotransferase